MARMSRCYCRGTALKKRSARKLCPIIAIAIAIFAFGCASAPPLNTPSQRPEVTIVGATRKQVLDAIVEAMLSSGAQLKRVDEYTAVFGRRDDSFGASLAYGSRYDIHPEMRITFGVVETASGLKVFASAAMVRNPGSAFEAVTDVTGGSTAQEAQAALERLKARLQSADAAVIAQPPARSAIQERGATPKAPAETKFSVTAEQYAKANGCISPVVTMNLKAAGAETFTVTCATGEPLTVRCEYGNCRALN